MPRDYEKGAICITLKDQLNKIKENWIIILVIILVFFFMSGGNLLSSIFNSGIASVGKSVLSAEYDTYSGYPSPSAGMYPSYSRSVIPSPIDDFDPNAKDRKVIKTADLTAQVKRGEFKDAESKLKNIISASGSFLLNQNVNLYGEGKKAYSVGYYQIKIETGKYESVASQLKEIGEVTIFRESSLDVTGSYTNTKIEIDSEKSRLSRYQQLFDQTADIQNKITLTDKIFDQERRIKYMEDSLMNIDKNVEYSSITVTINEKQEEYADAAFVKFSELVKGLIGSLNTLLKFIFVISPWAVMLFAAKFLWNLIKTRSKDKGMRK